MLLTKNGEPLLSGTVLEVINNICKVYFYKISLLDFNKIYTIFMKNFFFLVVLGVMVSCSSDDGFDDANGNVAKKYITKITTAGNGDSNVSTVTYNGDKKVLSASDGQQINAFTYNTDGSLNKISGGGDALFTSEIMGTIHQAYEIGDILGYDSKGNPTLLELYEDDYYTGERYTYKATLTYDTNPFAFYYTLDAAGIIDVLNNTQLNFSMIAASPEIILAKLLLPVNNPISVIIRDETNIEVARIDVSYVYNADKYPISSQVTVQEDGFVDQYSVLYDYLP